MYQSGCHRVALNRVMLLPPMPVAIYLGKAGPQFAPFYYLTIDPAAPNGFTWTTHHSLGTWFDTLDDAKAWIGQNGRVPTCARPTYYRHSTQRVIPP